MHTEFILSAKGKVLPNWVRWRKSVVLLAPLIIESVYKNALKEIKHFS